ncbi:MAG: IS6 family transposase, partial [Actinobacteria bacterium]|nr:IS6 family transposase [Actinomycetota bacterium]
MSGRVGWGYAAVGVVFVDRRVGTVRLTGLGCSVPGVGGQTGFVDVTPSSLYKGHRYPVEVISHCVWLYHRFPLSLREV